MKGFIFDIQGQSVYDGPGCRTAVFLSGCPLTCDWCSNPEGMNPGLSGPGKSVDVDYLMKIFKRDRFFWGDDGGVTFTGGEPLFQIDFLKTVLNECRSRFIHTAIETSGYASADDFMDVMELIEWAFIDIKHMNSELHKSRTGVSNTLILKNIKLLVASKWPGRLMIRVPLIPDFNQDKKDIDQMCDFLLDTGIKDVNLLPFHRFAISKYKQLNRSYKFENVALFENDYLQKVKGWFEGRGVQCFVGNDTPF